LSLRPPRLLKGGLHGAAASVELERLEAKFATSTAGENDFGAYVTGTNSLRRVLEAIGLERVARDVTPDLRTYLAEPAP